MQHSSQIWLDQRTQAKLKFLAARGQAGPLLDRLAVDLVKEGCRVTGQPPWSDAVRFKILETTWGHRDPRILGDAIARSLQDRSEAFRQSLLPNAQRASQQPPRRTWWPAVTLLSVVVVIASAAIVLAIRSGATGLLVTGTLGLVHALIAASTDGAVFGEGIRGAVLSIALTAGIGIEREAAAKSAGVRTFAMTGMLGSVVAVLSAHGFVGSDTARVASYFFPFLATLAGAVVIKHQGAVEGLTTAAALGVAGVIGELCGVGWYQYAAAIAALTLGVLLFAVILRVLRVILAAVRRGVQPAGQARPVAGPAGP